MLKKRSACVPKLEIFKEENLPRFCAKTKGAYFNILLKNLIGSGPRLRILEIDCDTEETSFLKSS